MEVLRAPNGKTDGLARARSNVKRLALATRGIRVTTEKADLDSEKIGSTHIGRLNRLPDTGALFGITK